MPEWSRFVRQISRLLAVVCGHKLLVSLLVVPTSLCTHSRRHQIYVKTSYSPGFRFPDCLFTLYPAWTSATETLTTLPPGLTLRTTSRDDWTTNTWYTTRDSNSNDHLIPVVVLGGPDDPDDANKKCPKIVQVLEIVGDAVKNIIGKIFPVVVPKIPSPNCPLGIIHPTISIWLPVSNRISMRKCYRSPD